MRIQISRHRIREELSAQWGIQVQVRYLEFPVAAEAGSVNQDSGRLESKSGLEQGRRAPSRFREQFNPTFPDPAKQGLRLEKPLLS